jgi:hypothetical protein
MAAFIIKHYIVTIQPNISYITQKLGLQAKALNKCFHISKMEDDNDFIPHLARNEFTFRVSVKTEKTQEFISLLEDTAVIVKQVRKKFKDLAIKATKIEYQVLNIQIATDLDSSFRLSTKSLLIADGIPTIHIDTAVNTVLDRHHEKLLKHSFATLVEFCEVYKMNTAIAVVPATIPATVAATAAVAVGSTTQDTSIFFGNNNSQSQPHQPTKPVFYTVIDEKNH